MKNQFLKNIEEDFHLFNSGTTAYTEKLIGLAANLKLKDGFETKYPPAYFVGNLKSKNKIIIIGINPGGNKDNMDFELPYAKNGWDTYIDFHNNFFNLYKQPIRYYSYFTTVLSGSKNTGTYFQYCNENIVNIDLIPYHSKKFSASITPETEGIYLNFFNTITDYLKENKESIRFVIIHKSELTKLLLKHEIITENNKLDLDISPKKKVYYKNDEGVKYLVFSRFIPGGGFSRHDMLEVFKAI